MHFRWQCFKGAFAYELQVGPVVIQVPFRAWRDTPSFRGRYVHVWLDRK